MPTQKSQRVERDLRDRERARERQRESERQRETESKRSRQRESARERQRETWPFGFSFCIFFLPTTPGLPYVNWASQECCLSYLRSSLQSSEFPLFYFRGLFLPCLLATAILDSFFPLLTT